jgi:hypothetical protein
MQAQALFWLGTVLLVTGMAYMFFRARKTVPYEVMLGTAMAIIGGALAIVGGLIWIFT